MANRRRPLGVLFLLIAVGFAGVAAQPPSRGTAWVIGAGSHVDGEQAVRSGRGPACTGAQGPSALTLTPGLSPAAKYPLRMAQGTMDTKALWQEFKRTGDRALRDRLILTYAPLVKYVAGASAPASPRTWRRATSSPTGSSA